MADKEERILITKVSPHCHALRFSCDPFDTEEGMFCDKRGRYVRITEKDCAKCKSPVLYGISRTEVVERMAKAICKISCNCKYYVCGNCTEYLEHYTTDIAEAALDALLEDK